MEIVTLNLSNYDTVSKVWNVAGQNLGLPIVRPQLIANYGNEPGDPDIPQGHIYYLDENAPEYFYISYLDEATQAENNGEFLSTVNDLAKLNYNLMASPLKVNKITVYTNNVQQLAQIYAYYQQNSTGAYERKTINVFAHYDPELPQTKIEIGKQYIGTIILDGNKRLEVTVLPKTTLIIELLYEQDDISESNDFKLFDDAEVDYEAGGKQALTEEEKKVLNEALEDIQNEIDMADLRAYVQAYYKYAKNSSLSTKIPPIFSLAQSGLETGFGSAKPGNNMFGIKASSSWKGPTVYLTTHECTETGEKKLETIKAPNKQCGSKTAYKVKTHFRAYKTPADSFKDHSKVLKNARYSKAFGHTNNPELFAREVARGGYATDTNYASKIISVMNSLKPYIKEIQVKEAALESSLKKKKVLAIATGGTILICILIFVAYKKGLLAKAGLNLLFKL